MGRLFGSFGIKEICEKFCVKEPKQIADLLGLWGDASDNIPGIPGVGEKTACALLDQFYSVEDVIARADEIKNPRLQQKVKDNSDIALKSKQLATIITDVPITFNEEEFRLKGPDERALRKILEELELRNLAKRIFTDFSLQQNKGGQLDLFSNDVFESKEHNLSPYKTIKDTAPKYHLVSTEEEARKLAEKLSKVEKILF